MSIKNIFKIFFKLFALYHIFSGIIYLIETIGQIGFFEANFINYFLIFLSPIAYTLLFIYLFYKTDFIISFLKLENGFDDGKINFGNLNSKEIIKIALLIFGFSLFIGNIPEFASHCFYSFKYSAESKLFVDESYKKQEYFQWTISGINILVGYLIITNQKRISNWIDKNQ